MIKTTKKYNFYRLLVLGGLIFWIAETAFFGWNDKPMSGVEKFADYIGQIAILWGLAGDLLSGLNITKIETTNLYPKNLVINGKKIDFKNK